MSILMLAGNVGLTQRWIWGSLVLIVIPGVGGAAIEDRWATRLIRADGDEFASILHEKFHLWRQ